MKSITLPSGAVVELHPTHVVLNGQRLSHTDFFALVIEAYYRLDLDHPRGSGGWLSELVGADLSLGCAGCGNDNAPTTRCPTCSMSRCARCAVRHDNGPLCLTTREYAETHRLMRGGDDLEPIDAYIARKFMAASFIRRGQH